MRQLIGYLREKNKHMMYGRIFIDNQPNVNAIKSIIQKTLEMKEKEKHVQVHKKETKQN